MDCDADEIMTAAKSTVAHGNPPEDDFQPQNPTGAIVSKFSKNMNTPSSFEADDISPWCTLEQMRKEANEVAMNSSPKGDKATNAVQIITIGDVAAVSSESSSRGEPGLSDEQATAECVVLDTAAKYKLESSLKDTKEPPKDYPNSPNKPLLKESFISDFTPFEKTSSGYVYPTKARKDSDASANLFSTAFNSAIFKPGEEGQEHTMETFNRFLEISSMTTDSYDLAVTMENIGDPSRDTEDDVINTGEDAIPIHSEEIQKTSRDLWPRRLLRTSDMADAPSGILLVFDRMLDCIDPGGISRPREETLQDEEHAYGYETDQSSVWSLSMNRSWLVREFGDISTTGSLSTDEGSLGLLPKGVGTSLAAEWLDESLDCIFPCWKADIEKSLLRKATDHKALSDAIEANRKRKWVCEREVNKRASHAKDPKPEGDDVDVNKKESKLRHDVCDNDHNIIEAVSPHKVTNTLDDLFDFPPPEFPQPVWKKEVVSETSDAHNDIDNASGSSLSELFDGLVFGTPSDEKDDEDDELQRILDRTSTTEETSTLSYSDGTV